MNPVVPDFRSYFESAPGPYIVVANDPAFTILAVNEAYLLSTNKVRDEITGRGLFEVFQNSNTAVEEAFHRIRETKKPETLAIQKYDIDSETRFWSPSIFPLLDAQGNVTAFLSQVVDVTETVNKDTERENFRKLFMQTPEMVVILRGPEHKFIFVNEAHIRVLGFDATGKTVREAQPESVEVLGILDNVYRTGKTAGLYEIPVTVTDRLRYFNLTYSASFDEAGKINGVMVMGIEVTDQVQARETLKNSIKTRDEFLSIVSHELRTPLTSMKIQTQLFHKTIQDEKLKPMMAIMERGVTRLARLVDDMLDMSRIQMGKLKFNKEVIELLPYLTDILERYDLDLKHAGIELTTNLQSGMVALIDPFRVEQVITNLVTNAIRYASRAPLDVSLKSKDGFAVITFQDHGPGIKKEDSERVFGRFERLVSPNEISGMGLGLFICKEIIEGHGGKITIEDNGIKGACFVIKLPL
ncbi:MAG: ATP-binding protein [Bacteriovoracaceae bacterium]